MSKRDSFLLRLRPEVMDALRRWADDEFRSVNSQIEFVLARALQHAGRLPSAPSPPASDPASPNDPRPIPPGAPPLPPKDTEDHDASDSP